MGVYLPPSDKLADYEKWLADMETVIRPLLPFPVVVAGDFNAWNIAWGSRLTNAKGGLLEDMAAALGVKLLNRGRVSTCIHPRGESIVDLT